MLETFALDALAAYVRHSPIDAGRWRVARAAVAATRKHGAAVGTRTIRTRHGFRMRLDLEDWVDQHIFATGEYEPDVVCIVQKALRRGTVAVDIGANVGFFSLLFASLVGPTGQVIAFEPQPGVRERLAENVRLNSLLKIDLRQEAVSDSAGELDFYCGPPEHTGVASLRPVEGSQKTTVATVPGDMALAGMGKIGFIKIDVEGAETRVIRGLTETLKRDKPDLVVEVSNSYLKQAGSSGAELCSAIMNHGYRMFHVRWEGTGECEGWSEALPDQFNALFTARPELITKIAT